MFTLGKFLQKSVCFILCSFLVLCPAVMVAQGDAEPVQLSTLVYYNPDSGVYYHLDASCESVHPDFLEKFVSFEYRDLFRVFGRLSPCEHCVSLDTQTLWLGEKEFREAWPVLQAHIDSLDILGPWGYAWRITASKDQITMLVQDEIKNTYEYTLALQDGQWTVEEPVAFLQRDAGD